MIELLFKLILPEGITSDKPVAEALLITVLDLVLID